MPSSQLTFSRNCWNYYYYFEQKGFDNQSLSTKHVHNFQKKRWWTSGRDSLKTYKRARGKASVYYIHTLLKVVQYGSIYRENKQVQNVWAPCSEVQKARLTQEIQLQEVWEEVQWTSKRKGPWVLRWHLCRKNSRVFGWR